ncbi:3354_t:CDS:2 [Diversispora eburnea]|uniref:3354_t:CDS:1 n=1 Tax=Diversispora eburnea TaxID=1213867 RepID=A0A9N9B5M8_9GLOM|nr:3354_t:CDS:2 [Diversispora eburnea]
MIQNTKLSKNSSKSNSLFLFDTFHQYTSSAEMKLDLSLSPTYKSSQDSEDTTFNALNVDTTPKTFISSRNQLSPLDSSSNCQSKVYPISPKVQPQIFSTSPNNNNDKTLLNSFKDDNLNSLVSSMSPMSTISIPKMKHKTSYSDTSSITLIEHTNDPNIFCENPETQIISYCANSQNNTNHLQKHSLIPESVDYTTPFIFPSGGLAGPSILIFEENPILKLSLKSEDPMINYLSKALMEAIDQSLENDNDWVTRRMEWIETIKLEKKKLEKHKKDKITLKKQIELLKLAIEKIKRENLILQKELENAQIKMEILEKEKIRNEEQWNSIVTASIATLVSIGIVAAPVIRKLYFK